MKRFYFLFILVCFLSANDSLFAQCSVNISTNPNTTQLNCINKIITLTANVTGSDSLTYLWNNGATTASIIVSDSGIYSVTITDGACSASSSVSITKDITTTIVPFAFPDTICFGGSSTLVCLGALSCQWLPGPLAGPVVTVNPVLTTTYTVTGIASNGCPATSTIQLVVHPQISASIAGSTTVCQNTGSPQIIFKGFSGAMPYVFTYNINGGPSQIATTTRTADMVSVKVPTGTIDTLRYNLLSVTDSNGCSQNLPENLANTAIVSIVSGPAFKSAHTDTVCNNAPLTYTATSSIPNTNFRWIRRAVAGITNLADSGTNATVHETLRNSTTQPITITYIFNLSAGTECITTDSVKVTVNPTPVIIQVNDITVCNLNKVANGIVFNSTSPNAHFAWTNSNNSIGLDKSGVDSIPEFTAINTTDRSISATINVSINASGCVGKSIPFRIMVLPAPFLLEPKKLSICDSTALNYTAKSSAAATTFTWTRPKVEGIRNSEDSETTATIKEALKNITDHPVIVPYIFTLSTGTSCVTYDTIFVTVNPALSVTLIKPEIICDNTPFTFTATTNAINPGFSWTRPYVSGLNNPAGGDSTATVRDTLRNITSQPVVASYFFNVTSTTTGCKTSGSVKITVDPHPLVDTIFDQIYCNGYFVNGGIQFVSSPAGASFTWTNSDTTIGLADSGKESVFPFNAKNTSDNAKTAIIKVYVTPTDISCPSANTSFNITVLPTAVLTSPKTAVVCNNTPFIYTAATASAGTKFSWTRFAVPGISNKTDSGKFAAIYETLSDTTLQPVEVKYIFTLLPNSNGSCATMDTVKVTVNPISTVDSVKNREYCNGDFVTGGISLTSQSLNASISWTNSDTTIGLLDHGQNSIFPFNAKNTTDTIKTAVIKVKTFITAGTDTCYGIDTSFTITVKPSPARPGFSSLSRYADNDTLKLCGGSENINFNVNSPVNGVTYNWTTNNNTATIKDANHANTVISFLTSGNDTIKLTAKNTAGCSNTVSQIVHLNGESTGIDKQKIFLMQPGNLLIYPDNSLTAYQWGYDAVLQPAPNAAYGPSVPVQGQVYQFFIPDIRFINNNSLNVTDYLYWVLLQNKSCSTKFYYNGPYANRVMPIVPADSTIQLQVFPNPNKGSFEISLKGNIYGNINAQIYNAIGQIVFRKNFVKTTPDINKKLDTNNLPGGLYFLILNSSDLKKVSSRFVIQR